MSSAALLAGLLLPFLTSALPTAAPLAPPPSSNFPRAQLFTLVAKQITTGSCVSDNLTNYVVQATHDGAGSNALVMVPYGQNNLTGTAFYTNGTGAEFSSSTSYVAIPGGLNATTQPPMGWGLHQTVAFAGVPPNIPATPLATNSSTGQPTTDNDDVTGTAFGTGTQDVWIAGWDGEGPQLGYPYLQYNNFTAHEGGSTWYVCDQAVYTGPQLALRWHGGGVDTPAECSEVVLVPQCAGDLSADESAEFLVDSPCLDDAMSVVVQNEEQ